MSHQFVLIHKNTFYPSAMAQIIPHIEQLSKMHEPVAVTYDQLYTLIVESCNSNVPIDDTLITSLLKCFKRDLANNRTDLKVSILRVFGMCLSNNVLTNGPPVMEIVNMVMNFILVDNEDKEVHLQSIIALAHMSESLIFNTVIHSDKDVSKIFLRCLLAKDINVATKTNIINIAALLLLQLPEVVGKEIYLSMLIPALFNHDLVAHEVRLKILDVACAHQRRYDFSTLNEEQRMNFKSELKTTYIPAIETFLNVKLITWKRLWIWVVHTLGVELHNNLDIINKLLGITESAFRKDYSEAKLAAYDCWIELINNYALRIDHMCSNKHMKLLIKPLTANISKTEEIVMKRFMVWIHFIKILQKRCVEKYIDSFLNFCFGPLGNNPLLSYENSNAIVSPVKKYQSLWCPATQVLIQILGHGGPNCSQISQCLKMKDYIFEQNIIGANVFATYSELLIHAVGECCVLMILWPSQENMYNVSYCLWSSLIKRISAMTNSQLQEKAHNTLVNLLRMMFTIAEKKQVLFAKCLTAAMKLLSNPLHFPTQLFDMLFITSFHKMVKFHSKNVIKQNTFGSLYEHSTNLEMDQESFNSVFKVFFESTTLITDGLRNAHYCTVWLGLGDFIVERSDLDKRLIAAKYFLWPMLILVPELNNDVLNKLAYIYPKLREIKLFVVKIFTEMQVIVKKSSKHIDRVTTILLFLVKSKCFIEADRLKLNQCITFILTKSNNILKKTFGNLEEILIELMDIADLKPVITSNICQLLSLNCTDTLINRTVKYFEDLSTAELVNQMCTTKMLQDIANKTESYEKRKILRQLAALLQKKNLTTQPQIKSVQQTLKPTTTTNALANTHATESTPLIMFGRDVSTMSPVRLKGSQLNNSSKTKKPTKKSTPPAKKKANDFTYPSTNTQDDYVVIDTEYNFSTQNLNEHQKEVLKKRRDDIPALYMDLSQSVSQDMFSQTSQDARNCPNVNRGNYVKTYGRQPTAIADAPIDAGTTIVLVDNESFLSEVKEELDIDEKDVIDNKDDVVAEEYDIKPVAIDANVVEEVDVVASTTAVTKVNAVIHKKQRGRPRSPKTNQGSPEKIAEELLAKKRARIEHELKKIHIDAVLGNEIMKTMDGIEGRRTRKSVDSKLRCSIRSDSYSPATPKVVKQKKQRTNKSSIDNTQQSENMVESSQESLVSILPVQIIDDSACTGVPSTKNMLQITTQELTILPEMDNDTVPTQVAKNNENEQGIHVVATTTVETNKSAETEATNKQLPEIFIADVNLDILTPAAQVCNSNSKPQIPEEELAVCAMDTETLPIGSELEHIKQSESIPSSPVTSDTPDRKKQLLDSTFDMSPIKLDPNDLFIDTESKKTGFCLEEGAKESLINAELLQLPLPKDIEFLPKDSIGDQNKSDDNQTKLIRTPQSNSRSAKLLNLVLDKNIGTPSRRVPIVKCEKLKTPPTASHSPRKSRFWKMLAKYEENYKVTKEKAESTAESSQDNENKVEILTFSRGLPSPYTSPGNSILKRKHPDNLDEGYSPQAKRKRVNFADPITATKMFFTDKSVQMCNKLTKKSKFITLTPTKLFDTTSCDEEINAENVNPESNSNEPNTLSTNELFNNEDNVVVESVVNDNGEVLIPIEIIETESNVNEQCCLTSNELLVNEEIIQSTGEKNIESEVPIICAQVMPDIIVSVEDTEDCERNEIDSCLDTQGSMDTTTTHFLDNKKSFYPSLITCNAPVENVVATLSTPTFIETLLDLLKSKNIHTVGDLVSLNEQELNRLPLKTPKLESLMKKLMEFEGTLKNDNKHENITIKIVTKPNMKEGDSKKQFVIVQNSVTDLNLELISPDIVVNNVLDIRTRKGRLGDVFVHSLKKISNQNLDPNPLVELLMKNVDLSTLMDKFVDNLENEQLISLQDKIKHRLDTNGSDSATDSIDATENKSNILAISTKNAEDAHEKKLCSDETNLELIESYIKNSKNSNEFCRTIVLKCFSFIENNK